MNRSIGLLQRLAERDSDEVRDRYSALITIMRGRKEAIQSYAAEAARIGEMEAELIDSKISARAEGLLTEWRLDREAIAILEAHLEGVLRPSEFSTTLERAAKELVEEIAERKLTTQAKAVLQSEYRMSEEQAHLHLRAISRKSRRPLKEVARELIDGRNSLGARYG